MRSNLLVALIILFAPLSLMSVGGGQSVIPAIQADVVGHRHWLTADNFVDDYAISRAAPGPSSLLVALIGWQVAGLPGALVASIAIFLPSSLLTFGLVRVWQRHKDKPWQIAIERGLAPISAGLILSASLSVLRIADGGPLRWIVAGLSLVVTMRAKLHPLVQLAAGAAIFLVAGAIGLPIGRD